MFVVFIHGPAAAGKHTIGTILADRMDLPLFHNHLAVDVATSLFEFGSDAFRRLRADIWRSAFAESARAEQSFIFTFNPEATVTRELIDELVATVDAQGGQVHFVELTCSRDAILERLGNDGRRKFGKLVDPALYEAIERSGGFDFGDLPDPLVRVDTEARDPDGSAAIIQQAVADRTRAGSAGQGSS